MGQIKEEHTRFCIIYFKRKGGKEEEKEVAVKSYKHKVIKRSRVPKEKEKEEECNVGGCVGGIMVMLYNFKDLVCDCDCVWTKAWL